MYIIESENDDNELVWWIGNTWTTNKEIAKRYDEAGIAEDVIEHLQNVSFGTKTDNAIVKEID